MKSLLFIIIAALSIPSNAWGLTANKVWMEFRPDGRYRVFVNYTVPEIKQFREAYVDFSKKKDAEKFYFDLVRGADFYRPDANQRGFDSNPKATPTPW